MKRILFIILAALVATTAVEAKKMSDLKVVVDPGHGGYDGDDRPIRIWPYEQNDTAGYWESKSNLVKGIHLKNILDSLGVDITLTRVHNVYNEIDGDGIPDEPSLSTRSYVANNLGADCFFSIHSNAGEGVNYPLMIFHRGGSYDDRTGQLTTYKAENERLCNVVNDVFNTSVYSNWVNYKGQTGTTNPGRVTADKDLLGYSLGVLRNLHGIGMLSEGGMHEHRPQAHRLMNDDYCWLEAWYFAKSLMIYFDTEDRFVTGNVAGVVYDNHNIRQFSYDTDFTYLGRDKNDAINFANVELVDAQGNIVQSRVTDDQYNGVFVFRNVAPGEYTVRAYNDKYYMEEKKVTVVADEVTYQDMPLCLKRTEPLTVLSYGPTGGDSIAVSCASIIEFEFNYDVDEKSIEEGLTITPELDGYFVYDKSFHKVSFVPTLSLAIDTTYTVTLAKSVKTPDTYVEDPTLGEDFTFTFRTLARNRLEMIDNYPADGGAVHYSAPVFEFRFDKTIEQSYYKEQIKVYDKDNNELAINARSTKFNQLSNGYGNAMVVLQKDLVVGETYRAVISGELRDKENLPMVDDVELTFVAKDVSGEKEGVILEKFNDANLFAYDTTYTVNNLAKPTAAKSTAKYLYDKASTRMAYSFADNHDCQVVWNYVAPDTVARTYAKGDVLGLHVYGDFNNHELWVGVSQGTDTKYEKLCDLNFRGWEYKEVQLNSLEAGYDYNFSNIKIVQVTSPITQKGEIYLDNLIKRTADEGGVEGVIADADAVSIYPIPASDVFNVDAPVAIKQLELFNIRGEKVAEAFGANKLVVSHLPQGVYIMQVVTEDGTTSHKVSISR